MSLTRWFRKNNRKIMAIVIIVIMIGFVGGSYIQSLSRRRSGVYKTIARFGEKGKITNYDIAVARQELDILRMIGASQMLKGIQAPLLQARDIKALLLNEILFPDRRESVAISDFIKQTAATSNYSINVEQINDIYKSTVQSEILWILLKNEAEGAGFQISNEQSGELLSKIVPQILGASYEQLMNSLMSGGANGQGIAEDKVLSAFGYFISVMEYSKSILSSESLTVAELTQLLSQEMESIDVESVGFFASDFADAQPEPTKEAIGQQFAKYKDNFNGDISDENPYGFGYKLDDMVQLEYLTIKYDDVAGLVDKPTAEEVESFYKLHQAEFKKQVRSDVNDPNSEMIDAQQSFAEVADIIEDGLYKKAINGQAEIIMQDAKAMTEAGFENVDADITTLDAAKIKDLAGDYAATAKALSDKYSVKVYSGKSGLLNAMEIVNAKYLGNLVMPTSGYGSVRLNQIVFAVEELGSSILGSFEATVPKMYENIGTLKSTPEKMGDLGELVAMVRVVDAQKAQGPSNVDVKINKNGIVLTDDDKADEFVVKDQVVADLKELAAMASAKEQAEKYVELAKKEGWDKASKTFNASIEDKDKDPNMFDVNYGKNLKKLSEAALNSYKMQRKGDSLTPFLLRDNEKISKRRDMLFSLVGKDKDEAENMPMVLELKADMGYLAVKSVKMNRITKEAFEANKAYRIYLNDFVESQNMAAIFYNPKNILKRMDYRIVVEDKAVSDANDSESGE